MGEYCEGQWWLKELDAMAGTPDQRRAVAVVRKMMAEQHQGEPVELKCWSCKAEFTLKERSDCDGCCWKCGVEIDLEDYAGKFAGEVERLRADLEGLSNDFDRSQHEFGERTTERDTLRAQLAERDALLRDVQAAMREYEQGCDQFPPFHHNQLMERIDAALSASAEPSAPKCKHCHGLGEIPTGKMIDQGYWQPPEPDMEPCPHCQDEPSAPVEKGFSEVRQQHYDEFMQRREARAALERKP